MTYQRIDNKLFVKLERGEDVVNTLLKLCKDEAITCGTISAIGGLSLIILGWYELASKSYNWMDFSGNLELVSLTGNISLLNDEPFLHIHCVVSDESFDCHGGHLREAIVGLTLEVIIQKESGTIKRKFDDETGLNLLELH